MECKAELNSDAALAAPAVDAPVLKPWIIFLFSLTCALAVANVYSAQPLLESIALSLQVPAGMIGSVVTVTQVGYAAGLIFLVPLGDRVKRKTLVVTLLLLSMLALIVAGLSPNFVTLLCAVLFIGLMAVVVQLVVAWAAILAVPQRRGKVVGTVTSGIVLGILLARFISGSIADIAGWRAVYLTAAFLMLLIACIVAKGVPATPPLPHAPSYLSLLASAFRLFMTEPQLRKGGVFALLIFAAFSMLWTTMVLPLSALSLSHTQIGMFGLAGVAGALAAAKAGAWADRGWGKRATGSALALLALSWLPIAYTETSLVWLVVGIIMLDFAVQTVHVISQSTLIAARPEAASRLVGAYMCFYSIGSATGAIVATQLYACFGWQAVCLAGAFVSACAFLIWLRLAKS
ncbi:MFS transporter [Pseudescherichia vulneris]|uniref:MFS transporter n=1 Tax=Pseudescherichia vulneris TaxID=566 RepID=UPI0012AB8AAA|nr:MFS transporter [Pseudescherichia vulneris]MDU5454671.1 MFS transporter [Pseudescherichia vulneris]